MGKFYITFGTDPGFPYQNTYIVAYGATKKKAAEKFREKHPDRTPGVYNFAFIYSKDEWEGSLNQKYLSAKPAEVIGKEEKAS